MPKRPDKLATLREHFAWMYGTLAMYHAAVEDGVTNLFKNPGLYFGIRNRFWKGYLTGKMKMRPFDGHPMGGCLQHLTPIRQAVPQD